MYLLSFAQKREKKRNEKCIGLEEDERKSKVFYSAFFDAFVLTFIKA
jgi:hypothetical protein